MKTDSNDNMFLDGLYGKIEDRVFYRRYGKTYVRKAAGSYNKIPSAEQAIVRSRFIEAVAFAKTVISNPILKQQYEKKAKKGYSAYLAAIAEYLNTH